MAATIKLVTYAGQTVTPKDDAIIYDSAVAQNGVFYGCDVTASGNTLYIAGGYGMIKGRFFEIENSSIPVTLASGDTLLGRLYIHLDLSNSEAPIQLLTETGSSLSTLEHDDDANYTDGVWDVEMATFNVTTSAITNLVEKFDVIRDRAYLQSQIDTLNSNLAFITPPSDGTTSISDNVVKNLAYIDLLPGSYVVLFNAVFDSNSTGSRAISMSTSNASLDSNWFLQSPASSAGSSAMQLLRTFALTSATRIYFTARILAGGITLNVRHHIAILKLK